MPTAAAPPLLALSGQRRRLHRTPNSAADRRDRRARRGPKIATATPAVRMCVGAPTAAGRHSNDLRAARCCPAAFARRGIRDIGDYRRPPRGQQPRRPQKCDLINDRQQQRRGRRRRR